MPDMSVYSNFYHYFSRRSFEGRTEEEEEVTAGPLTLRKFMHTYTSVMR